jgi:transposase
MANRVRVEMRNAIVGLWRLGKGKRAIARDLGVNRRTVRRCIDQARAVESFPNLTAGSDPPCAAEFGISESAPNLTAGSDCSSEAEFETSESAPPPAQRSGPPSKARPYHSVIVEKLERDLDAQRIWQDLRDDHGFAGSYECVKRYVRRLRATTPLPFRRIETPPGEEAQVDFGTGAPLLGAGARRRRRTHVFRVVLSCSRRGFSKVVLRQTTDEFLAALEDAFWHFGGVPKTIVLDNLKAAVTKADWFDPELNPKVLAFAEHYGCVFLPTKPGIARHKGKIEGGVRYVKNNALKGRVFESLEAQNEFLSGWEATIADVRIHGTTKKQVRQLFDDVERDALRPLPPARFPHFREATRVVHRDGFIEIERAYYSVPPEYVSHRVWVRWDSRLVHIFTQSFTRIASHAKASPGERATADEHIHSRKRCIIERGATYLLQRAGHIGANAGRWAEHVFTTRGVASLRVIQGLTSLAKRHSSSAIDAACRRAISHSAYRLKDVRALIHREEEQAELEFMSEHPIIRNPIEYGRLVRADLTDGTGTIVSIFDQ